MSKAKSSSRRPRAERELHSRPPVERMLAIHEQLQRKAYPNCTTLGRDLEVCTRTARRDLEFMQDRLQLPIEYDDLKHGYYYTREVSQFPTVSISESEVFALLVAQKAVAQYHGTPFEQPLRAAFQRLSAGLSHQITFSLGGFDLVSFRPFAPEHIELTVFQKLIRAIQQRLALSFAYKNLGAAKTQPRLVHPYHVACIENRWYLFAFDTRRKAMRTFALTRMSAIKVTHTAFPEPTGFKLDEYLRGSFGVFKGEGDFEVVIEFDAWAAELLRERQWHASQAITDFPNGGLRLTLRLNNLEEVQQWVQSWGAHATVIRPLMLADRIEQAATEVQTRYAKLRASPRP